MTGEVVFEEALSHGPWVAALASLGVSPVSYAVIAAVFERRVLRLRSEFAAVIFGDPLLALAIALGVWLLQRQNPDESTGAALRLALLVGVGCLGLGLWLWRAEFKRGFYTMGQVVAPTKIWHQLIVVPVLGQWTWVACLGGMLTADSGRTVVIEIVAKAGVVTCVVAWMSAVLYDRRHPKLGHPPYDWRKLRPKPSPWPVESTSLRAYGTVAGESARYQHRLRHNK